MSPWGDRAEEYLWLRRALGHELAEANRLLPRFVAYLDACGATSITIEAALAWAVQPEVGADSKVRARRMTAVRGFARHMAGIDPDTQIPPTGLVPYRQRWRPPFIYTDSDIQALMQQTARTIPTAARAATYRTVIGLLAATGMRIGEALRLERSDVDWDDRVITIRASKFAKSRELPVSRSVIEALAAYAGERDQLLPRVQTRTFFMSTTGTPVIYADFGATFRTLVRDSGVGRDSSTRPRTLSRSGARFRCCHRPVSPDRSPNPPCGSLRNGLSTVAAVKRGSWWAMGMGSCCPGRSSGRPSGGGTQVAADLSPVPAVPGPEHVDQSPPGEGVQLAEGPFGDGVFEVVGPASHQLPESGQDRCEGPLRCLVCQGTYPCLQRREGPVGDEGVDVPLVRPPLALPPDAEGEEVEPVGHVHHPGLRH